MLDYLKNLEEQISQWPYVSVHPRRFGAWEIRFGNGEVGHIHPGGVVDIPFPRSVRDALLAEGLADEYHWVPDSGWTTFVARNEEDLRYALWLMRLSYLRYALSFFRSSCVARAGECRVHLALQFRSLFEQFLPRQTSSPRGINQMEYGTARVARAAAECGARFLSGDSRPLSCLPLRPFAGTARSKRIAATTPDSLAFWALSASYKS